MSSTDSCHFDSEESRNVTTSSSYVHAKFPSCKTTSFSFFYDSCQVTFLYIFFFFSSTALTFSWIFNEYPSFVKQDSRRFVSQETGNLYIAKVELSDVGNYTCVVTNTVTKTHVHGPPTPLILRTDGESLKNCIMSEQALLLLDFTIVTIKSYCISNMTVQT